MNTNALVRQYIEGPNLTTPAALLAAIRDIVGADGAARGWLYGSRAIGCALPRSDFDIAVSGAKDFWAIADAVEELPTLYKIDLLNLDTCANALLKEEVFEHGRELRETVGELR